MQRVVLIKVCGFLLLWCFSSIGIQAQTNEGCTDPLSCNYSGDFAEDDGSCIAPIVNWQNTIGGSDEDILTELVGLNGGYLLGGRSGSNMSEDKTENSMGGMDYWVLGVDTIGNIIWQNTIGGVNDDRLTSIAKTEYGYCIVGMSSSGSNGDKTEASIGGGDYWVVFIDLLGQIVWQNTIGGEEEDRPEKVIATEDGGFIVAGTSWSGISGDKTEPTQGWGDYWVIKLDSNGDIVWQNTIGGDHWDLLNDVIETSSGNYLLAGNSQSGISGDKTEASQFWDYWILMLNQEGGIIWQNTIGGDGDDQLFSVVEDQDGNFILGGRSDSGANGDKTEESQGDDDFWIIKVSVEGNIIWQNTIGGSNLDMDPTVALTDDNGIVVTGLSASPISGDKTLASEGGFDYWIIRLNSDGEILWQDVVGGEEQDLFSDVEINGNQILLGGYSNSNISGDKSEDSNGLYDFWVVQLDYSITQGCIDPLACNYNVFAVCADESCEYESCDCQSDLTGDGEINTSDLLEFIASLGCSIPEDCPSDFNQDGIVNILDLLSFLPFIGVACE